MSLEFQPKTLKELLLQFELQCMVLRKDPAFDIYHVAFVTSFKSEVHHTSYTSENNLDKIKRGWLDRDSQQVCLKEIYDLKKKMVLLFTIIFIVSRLQILQITIGYFQRNSQCDIVTVNQKKQFKMM